MQSGGFSVFLRVDSKSYVSHPQGPLGGGENEDVNSEPSNAADRCVGVLDSDRCCKGFPKDFSDFLKMISMGPENKGS